MSDLLRVLAVLACLACAIGSGWLFAAKGSPLFEPNNPKWIWASAFAMLASIGFLLLAVTP